jgi:predicted nucleic acid-binding protein
MILRLGEAGAVRLLVSSWVLEELEAVVRRKVPEGLSLMALVLDRARVEVVAAPSADWVERSQALTLHAGDAQVLAAAWQAGVDYFITLDREHLLENEALESAVPFEVGTPGDFLAWFRSSGSRPLR